MWRQGRTGSTSIVGPWVVQSHFLNKPFVGLSGTGQSARGSRCCTGLPLCNSSGWSWWTHGYACSCLAWSAGLRCGYSGQWSCCGSNRCSGGHCWRRVRWRGSRPLGHSRGYIARSSVTLLHGIWVSLADVVTGLSVTSSSNDFNQVGSMGCLSDDCGG